MAKLRKLPKSIKLKGRYKDWIVKVETVSKETMNDLAESVKCKGYWDDEVPRIVIRDDQDLDTQWWALWHEMQHMMIDLWYMDEESYMAIDEEE